MPWVFKVDENGQIDPYSKEPEWFDDLDEATARAVELEEISPGYQKFTVMEDDSV
jgi:hypothetical protein